MIIRPTHCLHLVLVDITGVLIFKILSIPFYDFALVGTCDNFLAIFHPFYLIEGLFVLVFTLAHEGGWNRSAPIGVVRLSFSTINVGERLVWRKNVFGIAIVWVNARPILRIKIIVKILLIVVDFEVEWINPLFHGCVFHLHLLIHHSLQLAHRTLLPWGHLLVISLIHF